MMLNVRLGSVLDQMLVLVPVLFAVQVVAALIWIHLFSMKRRCALDK
jgi:hypothetical protein